MTPSGAAWHGCHGVRLSPETRARSYGACSGTPLGDATLAIGEVTDPHGRQLWEISTTVEVDGRAVAVDQRLVRDTAGTDVLVGAGAMVAIDHRRGVITTPTGEEDARTMQMVTTIAIPLLLHDAGVLVFHAAACVRDGRAVVVAGRSGWGKSSLLVALVDAGWQPVSEDMCAVELRDGGAWVWPGPPWVRRAPGVAGPAGSSVRFHAPDKTAWDLSATIADVASPVAALVMLEAPGGSAVSNVAMSPSDAIGHLARHAVWLGDPEMRAASLFGACAQLTRVVPASVLHLPRDPSWADAVRGVDAALSAAATTDG